MGEGWESIKYHCTHMMEFLLLFYLQHHGNNFHINCNLKKNLGYQFKMDLVDHPCANSTPLENPPLC